MTLCFTARTFALTGLVATDGTIDPECQALCVALERLPGVEVVAACSGHGEGPLRVWVTVDTILRVLACVAAYEPYAWHVYPQLEIRHCAECPLMVEIRSDTKGSEAYGEAQSISDVLLDALIKGTR